VSAAYIWSVIRRFYGAREGGQRTERFGYMPGGYAHVLSTMLSALNDRGVECLTASPVRDIAAAGGSGVALTYANEVHHFDQVIATFAGPQFAALVPTLPTPERQRHADLPYQGVVCLSLLLTRPLGGGYMTYITDESVPFTTVIEMSALTGTGEYGDHNPAYRPRYRPADEPLLGADDQSIANTFIAGLTRLYPDFDAQQVVAQHIARAQYVMTVPVCNYSEQLPPLQTSIAGLWVCNSAHIVDASLSVNEAVALANRSAPQILSRREGS